MAAVIEKRDEEELCQSFYLDRLEYPKGKSIKFIELAFKTVLVDKLIKANQRIVFIVGETGESKVVYQELSKKFYIEVFRALGMKVDSGLVEFMQPTNNLVSDKYSPLSEFKFLDLINVYSQSKTEILLDDDEMEVRDKILQSHCQLRKESACMQYLKLILLPWFKRVTILQENPRTYTDVDELNHDLRNGMLHSYSLKAAVASGLNQILQLVRVHMTSLKVRKIIYWLNMGDHQGTLTPLKLNWEKMGIFSEFQKQTKLVCWCYAIIDYLEAKYFKDHKRRIKLSRQELIDNLGCEQFKGKAYPYNAYTALEWIELNGLSMERHYPGYTGIKQTPSPKKKLVPILRIKGVQRIYESIRSTLSNQPVIGSIKVHESDGTADFRALASTPYVIYKDKKLRDIGHTMVLKGWDEWANPSPSYLVRDPSALLRKVKRGKFESKELNSLYQICTCEWTYIDVLQRPGKEKSD